MIIFRAIFALLMFFAGLSIALIGVAFVFTIIAAPLGIPLISAGVTVAGLGLAVGGGGQ